MRAPLGEGSLPALLCFACKVVPGACFPFQKKRRALQRRQQLGLLARPASRALASQPRVHLQLSRTQQKHCAAQVLAAIRIAERFAAVLVLPTCTTPHYGLHVPTRMACAILTPQDTQLKLPALLADDGSRKVTPGGPKVEQGKTKSVRPSHTTCDPTDAPPQRSTTQARAPIFHSNQLFALPATSPPATTGNPGVKLDYASIAARVRNLTQAIPLGPLDLETSAQLQLREAVLSCATRLHLYLNQQLKNAGKPTCDYLWDAINVCADAGVGFAYQYWDLWHAIRQAGNSARHDFDASTLMKTLEDAFKAFSTISQSASYAAVRGS